MNYKEGDIVWLKPGGSEPRQLAVVLSDEVVNETLCVEVDPIPNMGDDGLREVGLADVEGKFVTGEFREGSTIYRVTVCEECGHLVKKTISERIFTYSAKGNELRKEWAKQYPYTLPAFTFCECAHNQEDEE